jgi:hypothetical protein
MIEVLTKKLLIKVFLLIYILGEVIKNILIFF